MGRPFLFDPLTQHVLVLLYVMAAVLFLIAWRLPQGRALFPFGLLLLGLLALAGMSRHLGVTALVITLAAIGAMPLLQGRQSGSTRAAWRFLMVMLLALPFFLLAAWRVDLYREDVENAIYLAQAALFVALGMSLWLAVVPWHGWLTAIGAESPPVAAALVLTGFPLMALVKLVQVLNEATWFTWNEPTGRLILLAGLVSAAIGGLLAAVQRGFRPLMGYAALFDLGCLFVALIVRGGDIFCVGLVIRALGLGLTGGATAAVRLWAGDDGFAALRGAARRIPSTTVALMMGGFTLAGLPLTASFLPRWILLHDLAQVNLSWGWLLIGGSVGVAVGYLRGLRAMLSAPANSAGERPSSAPRLATIFLMALTLLSLGLALRPDTLLGIAGRLLAGYSLPAF
jgi:multicomponent Na+:H+ antiporter subunit D